ncbi:hypothetical protein [Myxococcus sp. RHSTA-1-4]|uniref:hypothetical protein n=1 Tax=Myxococcus sp. RHSTA-1-4 TaxID=2874601 RepID=UPI001CBF6B96|nr:hypothetical protein [Myxococcus sp. RHSTA-1-4]MBZ4417837.1 hypothetical protein [Myxococcus sp. RHSTA-1-4]
MSQLPSKVQPGDLITSDLFNRLIDHLQTQDQRLAELEASIATVAITDIVPTGLIRMGSEMRVLGRGFGVASQNTVLIESVMVNAFKAGSSDSQLIFNAPAVPNVPVEGKPVTLSVSNMRGFATTTIMLAQAEATTPEGSLQVSLAQTPSTTITAGSSYDFTYTIKAITNMEETYKLTPSVEPPAGTAASSWALVVQDTSGVTLANNELLIPKGDPPSGALRQVRVRVTIPSGLTGGSVKLRLAVTSKRNAKLTGSSGDHSFMLGSISTAPSIPMSRTLVSPSSAVVQDEVHAAAGGRVLLQFTAELSVAGPYTVTLSLPGDSTNLWAAKLSIASDQTPLSGQVNITGPGPTNLLMSIQPGATAPASVDLVVRITSSENTSVFGQVSQKLRRV